MTSFIAFLRASVMLTTFGIMSFIMLTFLLAGLVKGVIGMGLPTIAMGLLAKVLTPAEAAALLIVPSLVTNVWQLLAGPSVLTLLRQFWPLLIGIVLGTWMSSGVLIQNAGGVASMALGCVLIAYAALGLAKAGLVVPRAWRRWLAPIVGAVTGVLSGATGVFVIPAVPYLGALELGRDQLVQALGLSFTVSTLALAGSLLSAGAFHNSLAGMSLLALAPALLGMIAGQHLRECIKPATFRLCFFLGLLGLGLDQLLQAVFN